MQPPRIPLSPDPPVQQLETPWFQLLSRPILFLIATLALVGVYLTFSIPVAVFPNTDFPRVVIGVDNGVTPIDQMLVTVTRPLEEAVNSVPGLQKVYSNTSRGSAEVNLFFDWNVDMFPDFAARRLGCRACAGRIAAYRANRNAPPHLCHISDPRLQPHVRFHVAGKALGNRDVRIEAAA